MQSDAHEQIFITGVLVFIDYLAVFIGVCNETRAAANAHRGLGNLDVVFPVKKMG